MFEFLDLFQTMNPPGKRGVWRLGCNILLFPCLKEILPLRLNPIPST